MEKDEEASKMKKEKIKSIVLKTKLSKESHHYSDNEDTLLSGDDQEIPLR